MEKIIRRLSKIPTSALCDVGLKLAIRPPERVVMRRLRPLSIQSRAIGRARTQQIGAIRDKARASRAANWSLHVGLTESVQRGDFLVIAVAGDDEVASFGDLLAMQALARGATGVAVDGYIRDVAAIDRMGLPIWSRGVSMIPQGSIDYSILSINEPVTCGSVEVNPGDIVVADGDGVIVIPDADALRVAEAAEALEAQEEKARKGIKSGGKVSALYPKESYGRKAQSAK